METEGGSQLFETAEKRGVMKNKRGRVMQICVRDHVEAHPRKKKEVLYFVKGTWEKYESRVISCQSQSRTLNAVN